MLSNFYMSVDPDGNMPVMTKTKPAKKHYIKYVNDKPVSGCIYDGQDRVWDYSDQTMKALFVNVKSLAGNYDLAVIENFHFV